MSNYSEESTLGHPAPAGQLASPGGSDRPNAIQRAWATVRGRLAPPPSGTLATTQQLATRHLARWEWPALAAVLAVSAALNLIGLAAEGYANSYYAAAVRSMSSNWHAFFFNSFDSTGFVTVDKPPVGFWIQVAFVKLLGFHGWSILLPQALAGIAAVAILWWLIRRAWGPIAGLIAALALAVTPISVVTNRNNTIDSLLVLCVLCATWAVIRAIESPRHHLRWLLLGATLVGVGFNIKMLEAYLVLPALWLAYLVTARSRWYARIGHLALATILLVVVSLSWATIVDLTPASERPYVGSSQHNSVLELALGYNGLQRLLGRGSAGDFNLQAILNTLTSEETSGAGGAGGAGGVGGVSENGAKGLFRLLNQQLGGQIGWILPLAVVGLLAAAWQVRPRRLRFRRFATSPAGTGPLRRRRASVVIWGTWFATMAVFFSYAGFFHRYYLTMFAPGIAALVGLGVAALWQAWTIRGWRGILGLALPVALVGTAYVQRDILADYPTWSARLVTPILAVSAAAAAIIAIAWLLRRRAGRWAFRTAQVTVVAGVAALLVAPAFWAGLSVQVASEGRSTNLPAAGPTGSDNSRGPGGAPGGNAGFNFPGGTNAIPGGNTAFPGQGEAPPQTRGNTGNTGQGRTAGGTGQVREPEVAPNGAAAAVQRTTGNPGLGEQTNAQMIQWLIANRGSADYLLAVSSAQQASSIIIETGQPVMATGGFSGGDPILTQASLEKLVADGTIRYFLAGGGIGGGGFGRGGSNSFSVTNWVAQNCTTVPASAWGGTGTSQLYACGTAK
ncbi:MAG: glycosyltransferase family 39 protein [Chloroflexia bacterium]